MSEIETKIQNAVDEQQKKNAPAKLVVSPSEFVTHTQGQITSTSGITEQINSLFSLFNDYAGCHLYPYFGQHLPKEITDTMIPGNLYVDLYFHKSGNGGDGYDNLELISSPGQDASPLDKMRAICGSIGSRSVYRVNKDTIDMLSEFVPGYNPAGNSANPQWAYRIVEEQMQAPTFGAIQYVIAVRIIGLSLDALMGLIYGLTDPDDEGTTDKNGNPFIRYDYHCVPIATSMARINNIQTFNPQNYEQEYVIQILRNDRSIINAVQKALGLNNQMYGYTPLVRA